MNGNDIGKKKVRTNEFGSFTTEFILPAACLNGSYTIEVEETDGRAFIQVEEYKRPTFDIVLILRRIPIK